MISKQFAKRRKDSAVSPVIATILMVAITVVLAAVLYVMVGGFTHNPGTANSAGLNEAQNSNTNWTVSVSSASASNIALTGLKLTVVNVSNGAVQSFSMSGISTTITGPQVVNAVGGITVKFVNVNGGSYLSAGDYFYVFGPGVGSGASITLYNGNSQLGQTTL